MSEQISVADEPARFKDHIQMVYSQDLYLRHIDSGTVLTIYKFDHDIGEASVVSVVQSSKAGGIWRYSTISNQTEFVPISGMQEVIQQYTQECVFP